MEVSRKHLFHVVFVKISVDSEKLFVKTCVITYVNIFAKNSMKATMDPYEDVSPSFCEEFCCNRYGE